MRTVSFLLTTSNFCCRTRANASMWTSGLGVIEMKSRMLTGSDVLVVVLNESAAELDLEKSAFVSGSTDTVVDVTVRYRIVHFRPLLASRFAPCAAVGLSYILPDT